MSLRVHQWNWTLVERAESIFSWLEWTFKLPGGLRGDRHRDEEGGAWKRFMGFLIWEMWEVGLAGLSSAVLWIRQVFICMFLKRFVRTEESNRQERKDSMGRASI